MPGPWATTAVLMTLLCACGRSQPIEPLQATGERDGAGQAGSATPIVCARAQIACDGACIDPRAARAHCGATGDCRGESAGDACGPTEHCVDGTCADSCPEGYARCDGVCTNGEVDPDRCGATGDCTGAAAGEACPDDQVCVAGACQHACPPDAVHCDGRCIDPSVDRLHCGASGDCLGDDAGSACGQAELCSDGVCDAHCPDGSVQCDGRCIDPMGDSRFCGAAGACTGGTRGTDCGPDRVCFDGVCTDGCPPLSLECDGRCVDPRTDPLFCGATGDCQADDRGAVCDPPARCGGGVCQLPCEPGELRCGDACIDPRTDAMFCGATEGCMGEAIGAICALDEVCQDGLCARCPDGELVCDGACTDPLTDGAHCGASADCMAADAGAVCIDGDACVDGLCSDRCDGELLLCDGACIDPLVDRSHCGASGDCSGDDGGVACAQGQLCDLGQCVLDCPSGLLDCDGVCIQPDADPDHCGAFADCQGDAAGEQCAPDELCSAGSCVDACGGGLSQCVGGCVDLATDSNNCGSCRQRCAPQESCINGSCECPQPLTACDDACFDLQRSVLHCGGCGNACPPGKTCQAGQCLCAPGLADCGDHCANLGTDEDDCGACGQSCRLFEFCSAGQCQCQGDFTACDRGCTDTGSDARHCGGCGMACGAGERCREGSCECEPGFDACGGTCVDMRHDVEHCGGCDDACAAGLQCLDGQCSCGPGHAMCDGGCHDLFDSRAHCGACGNDCGGQACAGGSCRCVLHVDAATGNDQRDGESWGTAVRTLQQALTIADHRGCAIWMTGGTHYPDAGVDRDATFELLGAVALYGGFVGGETDPAQRVEGSAETILSGDLGVRGASFDNSYHVVHCDPVDGCRDTSVLDGITIEGGNANGLALAQRGGGLYCRDAMPTLRRVVFRNNEAVFGGGLFSIWGEMRATDCVFEDNRAVDGGAVYMLRADAAMTRVRFLQNRSQARGGAITQAVRAGLTVADCVFRGNRSLRGGGIYGTLADGEPVSIDTSTFVDNVASSDGGGIYCGDDWTIADSLLLDNRALNGAGIHGPPQVHATRFEGNIATSAGGGMLFSGAQPATLSQCTWVDNGAQRGGGLLVSAGSVTVEGALFASNVADEGAAVAARSGLEGGPWLRLEQSVLRDGEAIRGGGLFAQAGSAVSVADSTLHSNAASVAGGGLFADGATVELSACTLEDNRSESGGAIHASGANLAAANSVLWRNEASRGAGVFAEHASVRLLACTVIDNSASQQGGGVHADLSTAVEITGSILWGNSAGGETTGRAQYDGGGSGHITYSDVQGGCSLQSCTDELTGNLEVDPQFVDRAGGDLRLQPQSACVDAGDNAALAGVDSDHAGNPRIVDGPDLDGVATADMGALELSP